MAEAKLYELKKDVRMPGSYWRAGIIKTETEWKEIFDFRVIDWEMEWFIDRSKVEEPEPVDVLGEIIKHVFKSKHLHSITFKEVAREIAERYRTYLQTQNKL